MEKNKLIGIFLTMALSVSMLAGCAGNSQTTDSNAEENQQETEQQTEDTANDDAAAANQLLIDLTGKYQQLWPVLLADDYKQVWLDDCAKIVGEENAETASDQLISSVTSDIYGKDAEGVYTNESFAFYCAFTNDMDTVEFDGENSVIKGYDKDGNELFSHKYDYVGLEESWGMYEFKSEDEDSGEFTYFFIAPDTSASTYHIEFRYGSDEDALKEYFSGEYGYWMASGISTECDQTMIENCIELFCTENLAEEN